MSPVGWKPKTDRLQQLIQEEETRIQLLAEKRLQPEVAPPIWTPAKGESLFAVSQRQAPAVSLYPEVEKLIPISRLPVETLEKPVTTKVVEEEPTKEKPVTVPFWQRALQIFAAPFNWVDENIIEPSLAILGTTTGFVPEVERQPGEDYFEWKKRSWQGWAAPGIDINVPWSDKPLRVDIKGVMELAPWLLIPGAGTVGGAARGAAGIAGMLSKAGRVGRILGRTVEYSPWGLVEKSAGVAIKGGFRAVGKVSENVSTAIGEKLYGKYVPPPVLPAVAKITRYAEEVVMPAREAFEKVLSKDLRARQEAAVRLVQKEYLAGKITLEELQTAQSSALKEVGALKPKFALTKESLAKRQAEQIAEIESRIANGELTESGGKALITKIRKSPAFEFVPFERAEVDELNRMILEGSESGLLGRDSGDALTRLLLGQADNLPERHHLEAWGEVFGPDFVKAIKRFKTPGQVNQFVDGLNLPRSLLASMDLSATFRQGLILTLLHPLKVPVWFGKQVKALLSEKLALGMDDALRARPLFKNFVADGGYIAPLRNVTMGRAEEMYMSRLAERIPGVRRSERAFVTYLNEARMTAYESAHASMTAQGATPAHFKMLAQFINQATGRGSLPRTLEKYSPALNAVLFSPRLQMATLQMPRQIGRMLLSENPYMRKEAAKALVTFAGGGAGLLGLLHSTGVSKVELDPRSGDFGKIKVGETRLDIWRGYLQYIRFAAQLLSGERKSAYGNMNKAERGEIASRFLQSKSSPAFGLLVDLLRGENYMGNPIFKDTTGFIKTVRERVLPLAVQDIIDATEQGGINQSWVAAPALLGIGALTYVNDFVRVKEKIARELGYESWDDIDPKTQREIQNRNTELQAATIAFDRQLMGTAWGDWRLAGNAIEDVFRQNIERAVAEYRQTGNGVQFSDKVSEAFTARRGGRDAREKEERFADIVNRLKTQDTAEAMISLGPEQIAIKIYNDALFGDDMYDEFGNYLFDEATRRKEQLRQMLGQELFNYIEDYQEVKFETLPDEFQELMRARELMRPYWEVRNRVIKQFGERFAETSRGQALISKLRKQKRMSNPDLERAYQQFYVGEK